MIIFDIVAAIFFVASSGIIFNNKFRNNTFLVICSGVVALVSTYFLSRELVRDYTYFAVGGVAVIFVCVYFLIDRLVDKAIEQKLPEPPIFVPVKPKPLSPAVQHAINRAREAEVQARDKAAAARAAKERACDAAERAHTAAESARSAAQKAKSGQYFGYSVSSGGTESGDPWTYAGQTTLLGRRSGYGVMSWSSGALYEGEWRAGHPNGVGAMSSGGERYEGEWSDSKRHGVGILSDETFRKWFDEKRKGSGLIATVFYADGTKCDVCGICFEGEFYEDKYSGLGVLSQSTGARYEGQWLDSRGSGLGVLFCEPGSKGRELAGECINRIFKGFAAFYQRDGTAWIGSFENNLLNGYGAKLNKNGEVTEQGYYENGILKIPLDT